MAWIRQVGDDEAEGALARHYRAALERAGRIYGIVRLHSLDPELLGASMRLYRATTTRKDAPLTDPQRELIAVVTSKANDCFY